MSQFLYEILKMYLKERNYWRPAGTLDLSPLDFLLVYYTDKNLCNTPPIITRLQIFRCHTLYSSSNRSYTWLFIYSWCFKDERHQPDITSCPTKFICLEQMLAFGHSGEYTDWSSKYYFTCRYRFLTNIMFVFRLSILNIDFRRRLVGVCIIGYCTNSKCSDGWNDCLYLFNLVFPISGVVSLILYELLWKAHFSQKTQFNVWLSIEESN